jgi:hypothetical protein
VRPLHTADDTQLLVRPALTNIASLSRVRTPGAHTGCRYGDRDRSSLIKAGSTLLFELELVALA